MRKVKKKYKEGAQLAHAKRRFEERLGIEFTQNIRDELVHRIRAGTAKLVERQSLRLSVFETELENTLVHLVYDKRRNQIITILFANPEIEWQKIGTLPRYGTPLLVHKDGIEIVGACYNPIGIPIILSLIWDKEKNDFIWDGHTFVSDIEEWREINPSDMERIQGEKHEMEISHGNNEIQIG